MATLTIYHGTSQPIKAIGKHQVNLLGFAHKYKGWHSFAGDAITRKTVKTLEKKGYLEVNQFEQFRFVYPTK
jgi:hypothetical protein